MKDLMQVFDQSSLRELTYKEAGVELTFSKNHHQPLQASQTISLEQPQQVISESLTVTESRQEAVELVADPVSAEGDLVESPLVGVAYLSPAPDKPAFVCVGDQVKKGQTLLIVEAMKVMNEVPAPKDGQITEILVSNEAVIEYGQGLVRIK